MTCIVAIKKEYSVLLGGDSAASGNNRKVSRLDKKIFKLGDIIFGFAGSFRIGQLIKYQLKIPNKIENINNEEYVINYLIREIVIMLKQNRLVKNNKMDCNLLIGLGNQIYKVDSDFQIEITNDEYASIGDGEDFALGALYALKDSIFTPEEKAQKALEASARYCTTVEEPFYYLEN